MQSIIIKVNFNHLVVHRYSFNNTLLIHIYTTYLIWVSITHVNIPSTIDAIHTFLVIILVWLVRVWLIVLFVIMSTWVRINWFFMTYWGSHQYWMGLLQLMLLWILLLLLPRLVLILLLLLIVLLLLLQFNFR